MNGKYLFSFDSNVLYYVPEIENIINSVYDCRLHNNEMFLNTPSSRKTLQNLTDAPLKRIK